MRPSGLSASSRGTRVTLATGISEALCRRVNLGYRDPRSIAPADWQGRPGRLYVPRAGEMLYRLKDPPPWQRFQGGADWRPCPWTRDGCKLCGNSAGGRVS